MILVDFNEYNYIKRRLQIFLDKESEKTSVKVGENKKIEQEGGDRVVEEKEEGKVSERNNKKRDEGSIEQGCEKQPLIPKLSLN